MLVFFYLWGTSETMLGLGDIMEVNITVSADHFTNRHTETYKEQLCTHERE